MRTPPETGVPTEGGGRKRWRMRERRAHTASEPDESASAARWRVAISRAKVEAIAARASAQAEEAIRLERLSKGFTAKPSPRERIQQQQVAVNRAKIYALNAVLARQADARWHELRRQHGAQTPQPELTSECEECEGARPASISTGGATLTKQKSSRVSPTSAMEANADRSLAHGTPPLTPPSPPSLLCMPGELRPAGKPCFEATAASASSSLAPTQLPLEPVRQKRGGRSGCCGYVRRHTGTQVIQQQGHVLLQLG